ncbi:MAG: FAD-dependent oxidoreductase [Candidatus Acidiferrum sp.]
MDNQQKVGTNRRGFLKTAAAGGVAAVASAGAVNALFPAVAPETMSFEANRSFWSDALLPAGPPLQRNTETDIAIIGGGLTGLSAGFYLKETAPDRRVVLLEAARCGNGASARNGAMLLTSTEDSYMEWSGNPALDKRIYELTVDNSQRLAALASRFGVDAEVELSGALQMCNTPELARVANEYVQKARGAGLPYEYWDRRKIAEVIGTDAYPGATYDPNSGQAHPGKLVALFKTAAESNGVEIYENTPVVQIEEGERFSLRTANGQRVHARILVLAANAYSSKLGYLRSATAPVFDYVAMTAPLSDSRLREIGWKRRIPFNDSRTEVYYLGLTRDNRIHIGGGPVDYVFNNGLKEPPGSRKRFAGLHEELVKIFPESADLPFERTWSGAVDMSLDSRPAVGFLGGNRNLLYAIGFSGHGLNLTSVFGRILADLANGRSEEWSWFPYFNRKPYYIPNEPFRWLGVQAALGYYRASDPQTP